MSKIGTQHGQFFVSDFVMRLSNFSCLHKFNHPGVLREGTGSVQTLQCTRRFVTVVLSYSILGHPFMMQLEIWQGRVCKSMNVNPSSCRITSEKRRSEISTHHLYPSASSSPALSVNGRRVRQCPAFLKSNFRKGSHTLIPSLPATQYRTKHRALSAADPSQIVSTSHTNTSSAAPL